jgi:hypothetical protein
MEGMSVETPISPRIHGFIPTESYSESLMAIQNAARVAIEAECQTQFGASLKQVLDNEKKFSFDDLFAEFLSEAAYEFKNRNVADITEADLKEMAADRRYDERRDQRGIEL